MVTRIKSKKPSSTPHVIGVDQRGINLLRITLQVTSMSQRVRARYRLLQMDGAHNLMMIVCLDFAGAQASGSFLSD
jgi:hypothetical protein